MCHISWMNYLFMIGTIEALPVMKEYGSHALEDNLGAVPVGCRISYGTSAPVHSSPKQKMQSHRSQFVLVGEDLVIK